MSLIGSLEQFDLANILRRIEVFSKTGLLVVKQGTLWVEFYFRQGQLVCIGPMRANTTLLDRLLQANLLSFQSLPQIKALLGSTDTNETRIALTLINEGYLSREVLRAWAALETSQILRAIFSWQTGEVYFEDDCPTPADRLLVALSISALLDTLPATDPVSLPRPASANAPSTNEPVSAPARLIPVRETPVTSKLGDTEYAGQVQTTPPVEPAPSFTAPATGSLSAARFIDTTSAFDAPARSEDASGLFSASQLIDDHAFSAPSSFNAASLVEDTPPPPLSFASEAPAAGLFGSELDISAPNTASLLPPQPVANPLPPTRINTDFMTPELILVPVDLSSLRERNPQVQLTPDQWRLFALVDGQASLQALCQALMAPAEQVCTVAGELMAIGLVMPFTQPGAFPEMVSPASTGGMSTMAPSGQYPVALPARSPQAVAPAPSPFMPPIETQSQWGNGTSGATFMVGGGWMLSAKQEVPRSTQGQSSTAYAYVGGYR